MSDNCLDLCDFIKLMLSDDVFIIFGFSLFISPLLQDWR